MFHLLMAMRNLWKINKQHHPMLFFGGFEKTTASNKQVNTISYFKLTLHSLRLKIEWWHCKICGQMQHLTAPPKKMLHNLENSIISMRFISSFFSFHEMNFVSSELKINTTKKIFYFYNNSNISARSDK